jgi:hypothetical protein
MQMSVRSGRHKHPREEKTETEAEEAEEGVEGDARGRWHAKRRKYRERQIDAIVRERERQRAESVREAAQEADHRLTAHVRSVVMDGVLKRRPELDKFAVQLRKALNASMLSVDPTLPTRDFGNDWDLWQQQAKSLAQSEAFSSRFVEHGQLLDLLVPNVTRLIDSKQTRWRFVGWKAWSASVSLYCRKEDAEEQTHTNHDFVVSLTSSSLVASTDKNLACFRYDLDLCNVGQFVFYISGHSHHGIYVTIDLGEVCVQHAKHLYQNVRNALNPPLLHISDLMRIILGYVHPAVFACAL